MGCRGMGAISLLAECLLFDGLFLWMFLAPRHWCDRLVACVGGGFFLCLGLTVLVHQWTQGQTRPPRSSAPGPAALPDPLYDLPEQIVAAISGRPDRGQVARGIACMEREGDEAP